MRRGEVWWAEGTPDWRPVLILTRESVIPLVNKVVVVPATTSARGIPSEVTLDRRDGMPRPCVLSFDNVRLLSKSLFRSRITTLSESRLDEVCESLRYSLGC